MTDATAHAGATGLAELSANKCFGGWQKRYSHKSSVLKCDIQFSVFIPPISDPNEKLPVLYWLSGLT
jgi:S-formylglutathione hydrolase